MIPLGEWKPDLPDYLNDGATEALNVLPAQRSYLPLKSLEAFSGALTGICLGATRAVDADSTTANFAGDTSVLYKLAASGAWSDVKIAGGYSTAADGRWNFAQYGDQVIATNFADNIQEYTLGTSSLFANLTTAVKSKHIGTLKDFVVLGNTYDATDGNVPHRVRWCAIGDPTDWTVSASTQADYQDLDSSKGEITAVVGGEHGVIFQKNAVHNMIYVGTPSVFAFDEVEQGVGCFVPNSVVTRGRNSYYIGIDGFYMFDRNQSIPIGVDKINKQFFADFNYSYQHRVSAAADPKNNLIFWAYPSNSSITGNPDRLIIYDWVNNRWSHAEIDSEFIYGSISLGYTLDTLDTYSTDLDALPFSLDSQFWQGGDITLTAFDTAHKSSYFTGTQLEATIETSEIEGKEGFKTFIRRLRPVIDGTTTIQVGTRNSLSDSVTWSSAYSQESNGEITVLEKAMYFRFRLISSSFTHAQGVTILEKSLAGRY